MSSRSAIVSTAVLLCASAVGVLAIASDAIPPDVSSKGAYSVAFFGLAVIANDIVSWFVLSMVIGRLGGKSPSSAGLVGAAFSLTAIMIYLAGSSILHGQADPGAIGSWILAAGIGGGLGGCVGWLYRNLPVVLILPIGLAMFRIVTLGEVARSTMFGSWVVGWCAIVIAVSSGYALRVFHVRRRPRVLVEDRARR